MRFHYIATRPDGKVVEGDIEAENSNAVFGFLASKELKPISIGRSAKLGLKGKGLHIGKAITVTDQIFLTKHLALMLRLGTDLLKALDILIVDTEKPALKSLLTEIKETLEKGQPFYVTFARYPKYFSPIFVNLVKAGEASGNLDSTFDNLSTMLSQQEDLRRKIRSALIYPILLMVASFLILAFLVTFALPRIADIFLQGGLDIPTFSKVVFVIGLFLAKYVWYLGGAFITLAAGSWYYFARTVSGRRLLARFLDRVPVVNKVIERIAIQRFAATLSSLMKAGVPIVESLEITATSVGYQAMSDALRRIAREGVSRGMTLGEAFKKESAFPLSVNNLIAVSERAGHLDEVLKTLSTFYEAEIESSIKTMVSFVEPVLLIFIGGIVALIALSVIVPVYQLVGQF